MVCNIRMRRKIFGFCLLLWHDTLTNHQNDNRLFMNSMAEHFQSRILYLFVSFLKLLPSEVLNGCLADTITFGALRGCMWDEAIIGTQTAGTKLRGGAWGIISRVR